jgi:ribonuclease BN (tRNA processing enzyme)
LIWRAILGGIPLNLTVLGTSAAYPGPDTPCSGYLIQENGGNVLLDCGTGTLGNLQKHLDLRDVSDIVISHMHPDHFFDLIPYRYALKYGLDTSGHSAPHLHLPPGGIKALNQVISPFNESKSFFAETFDLSEYDPENALVLGHLQIMFRPVKHYIPTFGVSIIGSKRLAYSSDSGACPELSDVAKDADLLLCTVGRCLGPEIDHLWGHLLPEEAGELAKEARAKRLLLTHFWPACDPSIGARKASEALGHPVEVAEVNRCYEV